MQRILAKCQKWTQLLLGLRKTIAVVHASKKGSQAAMSQLSFLLKKHLSSTSTRTISWEVWFYRFVMCFLRLKATHKIWKGIKKQQSMHEHHPISYKRLYQPSVPPNLRTPFLAWLEVQSLTYLAKGSTWKFIVWQKWNWNFGRLEIQLL